jgi:hypothetical protein
MFHVPYIFLDRPLKTYSNMESQFNDGYTNYKPQKIDITQRHTPHNINIPRKKIKNLKIDLKDKQTFKNIHISKNYIDFKKSRHT